MAYFHTIKFGERIPRDAKSCAFLVHDNWDDWGKYQTVFNLTILAEDGQSTNIGRLKIGEEGLKPSPSISIGQRAPSLPSEFDKLPDHFFSLGQNESFYESLAQFETEDRIRVLLSLRDCAYDLDLFARVEHEDVAQESLLRDVNAHTVRTRFHRLARGNATLSKYKFRYMLPMTEDDESAVQLTFEVTPYVQPPTNVHVLIGRNGVGKSRCIHGIARALASSSLNFPKDGHLEFEPESTNPFTAPTLNEFTGLVVVSFSAFDSFTIPVDSKRGIRIAYVGLQKAPADSGELTKSRNELADEFVQALRACRRGTLGKRLKDCLAIVETDPIFADADLGHFLNVEEEAWESAARNAFLALSSGHAIVALTIARLVEIVGEKTLVLLDEPESHLHPPLLSALVRCVSRLLIDRNGVAIVSTHSPVVLQEVPRACVWILQRTGKVSRALRPTIETFGENVASLTREAFGLEVTNSGFHKLLEESLQSGTPDYQQALRTFNGQLGADARAILMTLVAERGKRG